jgi:hypothetical protein
MAHGIPVLATPKGTIPSQIGMEHYILHEENYPEAASNLIKIWYKDPELYLKQVKISANAYESALTDCKLSIENLLESIRS